MEQLTPIESAKKQAAEFAAGLVENGMRIGLGTGSTAYYFIQAVGKRCKEENLQVKALASSLKTMALAQTSGIPLISPEKASSLDLTVDGADEIDLQKRMIKGGGGALFREKIVASMSREMIVIIDQSKLVKTLGKHPVPLEIAPFGYLATLAHLKKHGYKGGLRLNQGAPLLTDNENYLFDIQFSDPIHDPSQHEEKLRSIPGVIVTGFFIGLAGRVIVGHPDNAIEIL